MRAARRSRTAKLQTIAAMVATAGVSASLALAAAPAAGETNVIQNGTFSAGLSGWPSTTLSGGKYSGYPHFLVISSAKCEPKQEGNPFLELDVPGGAGGYVQQQVTVPAAPGPLTFRTWGNLEPVQVTISFVSAAGGVVHRLLAYYPPTLQAPPATCSGKVPISESLDVSSLAGQTGFLRIQATSTGFDGTIANFDDFALSGSGTTSKQCEVPKVKGLTLAAAEHALTRAGCGVGSITKRPSHKVRKGRVISSGLPGGSRRGAGAKVSLVVSRG